MSENDAILKVNGLKTYFYQASGVSKAVDGVSWHSLPDRLGDRSSMKMETL